MAASGSSKRRRRFDDDGWTPSPTDHDHDTADHGDDAPKRAPEGSQAGVLNDFDQTNGIIERLYGTDSRDDDPTTTREIHTVQGRRGRRGGRARG